MIPPVFKLVNPNAVPKAALFLFDPNIILFAVFLPFSAIPCAAFVLHHFAHIFFAFAYFHA